jgi:hypothetical protein
MCLQARSHIGRHDGQGIFVLQPGKGLGLKNKKEKYVLGGSRSINRQLLTELRRRFTDQGVSNSRHGFIELELPERQVSNFEMCGLTVDNSDHADSASGL